MDAATATIKRLAQRSGLDPRTVRSHLRAAGLLVAGGSRIDEASAFDALKAHVDPALVIGHSVGGRGNIDSSDAISTLSKAKADAETQRARKLRLEVDIKEGKFIDRRAVENVIRDTCTRARSSFLGLGSGVAGQVAGMTDEIEIAAIITDAARRALSQLADADAFVDEVLS